MPELPEVKVVVNQLKKYIIDKKIINVEIFLPKLIKEIDSFEFVFFVKDQIINDVENYGKFIVFNLNDNKIILSHLRMEGKYRFYQKHEKSHLFKHDHLIFNFEDNSCLHYNDSRAFGTFHIRLKNDYLKRAPLLKLGKLAEFWKPEELLEIAKTKSQFIKLFLLDQSYIVGLGNIYVNEVLFATKINPKMPINQISLEQWKNILMYSDQILRESEKLGGSSIHSYTSLNQQEGQFQNFLKVHGKNNQNCPNCNDIIVKIKLPEKSGRGTYFCPTCQKVS